MRRLFTITMCLSVGLMAGCKRQPAVIVHQQEKATTANPTMASPPVVGCPSDGQQGSEPAPENPDAPKIQLASSLASRLAYYQGAYGLGVLAPRGWHCLDLAGSSGSFLLVTPELITGDQLFSQNFRGLNGPAVQLGGSDAGTSGRFEVAAMIRRVFPAHEAFAKQVIAEGVESAKDMPRGPYLADNLTYLSPEWLEYTTPPYAKGLGTHTHLNANDQPIQGFVMLAGDSEEYDLEHLSVRLAPTDFDLRSVISKQAETEAQTEPKTDLQK